MCARVWDGAADNDAGIDSAYKSIWDVPANEIAMELTFMDWHLFQSIPQAEFLAQGWDRPRWVTATAPQATAPLPRRPLLHVHCRSCAPPPAFASPVASRVPCP